MARGGGVLFLFVFFFLSCFLSLLFFSNESILNEDDSKSTERMPGKRMKDEEGGRGKSGYVEALLPLGSKLYFSSCLKLQATFHLDDLICILKTKELIQNKNMYCHGYHQTLNGIKSPPEHHIQTSQWSYKQKKNQDERLIGNSGTSLRRKEISNDQCRAMWWIN